LYSNSTFVLDDQRQLFLNIIHKRISKGKSTLVVGKFGSGKTLFLSQIKSKKFNISKVESLGSLNYVLTSILRQCNYNFIPNINKSVEYLEAICSIKNNLIIIDDINDLKPGLFRHLKRIMDANIPIIMAGTFDIITALKERHEDVLSRLRILYLESVPINDLKMHYSNFDNDSLEIISGFAFGNMWIFNEICEECLEHVQISGATKITANLINKIIQTHRQLPL